MEVRHRAPYILDTSALRALPGKILEEHTFYTSPYCFWELLTHLDEGQFTRRKGQLMKLRFTHILDDPRAAIETPLLIYDARLQDRVSDEELITTALTALQDSDSLERFYSSYIKDSRGHLRQVSDCAAGAQKALEEAEKKYAEFIQNIIGAFLSGQVKLENDLEHHAFPSYGLGRPRRKKGSPSSTPSSGSGAGAKPATASCRPAPRGCRARSFLRFRPPRTLSRASRWAVTRKVAANLSG